MDAMNPWRWMVNRIKLWRLRRDIQAGFDSGPGEPADVVFARLEARYQRMQNDRR